MFRNKKKLEQIKQKLEQKIEKDIDEWIEEYWYKNDDGTPCTFEGMSAAEIAARRDGFKAVSLKYQKECLGWRLEKYPVVDRITSALERRSNLNCAIDLINRHDLYGCFDQRELMQILIAVEQLPRDPCSEQSIKEQFEKIMKPFEEAIELLRQEKQRVYAELEQARKSRIEAEALLKAEIQARIEAEARLKAEIEARIEAEQRAAEKKEELTKLRRQLEKLVKKNRKTKASFFLDPETSQGLSAKRSKPSEENIESITI